MNACMWTTRTGQPSRAKRRAAFTLVEVILTILIVSVGLAGSLRVFPVLLQTSAASRQMLVAQQLASELLAEMAMLPYEDLVAPVLFGPEAGESPATRAAFDDVDDYNGWTASPPQKKDGTVVPNTTGYTQAVVVQSVDPANFAAVVGPGTSEAKRMTVTITRAGMPAVVVTSVRLKGVNREDLAPVP